MLLLENKYKRKLINMWMKLIPFKNHDGIFISSGSSIRCSSKIGKGSRINGPCIVKGAGNFEIGKYCALGENIRIITSNHSLQGLSVQYMLQSAIISKPLVDRQKLDVLIGNDVWIGDSVLILPGVTIGNGAIVGAGSVVTKSVPPFSVVAGAPARKIRNRFPDEIMTQVMHLEWWNWPLEKMKANSPLFSNIKNIDFYNDSSKQ